MMSVDLVTISFRRDYEVCMQLCETVRRLVAPSIGHLLIVPHCDVAMFRKLGDNRTRILAYEEVLPPPLIMTPFSRKVWLTPVPVRGWLLQQILKVAAAEISDRDVLVFADSDIWFVRPFDESYIIRDGAVRLYHAPFPDSQLLPGHTRWHKTAARLLGIRDKAFFGTDYISPLISWRRQTVLDMCKRISQQQGRPWHRSLVQTLHFSEYITYGVFVEHFIRDTSHHYYTTDSLSHVSWHFRIDNNISRGVDVNSFILGIKPNHVAACIQTGEKISAEDRRLVFNAFLTFKGD